MLINCDILICIGKHLLNLDEADFHCSHKKKRMKQIKKMTQRGLLDPEKADTFSLFMESGGLTHCLYKESEKILGNTFGMCILQVPYTSY